MVPFADKGTASAFLTYIPIRPLPWGTKEEIDEVH
jgi:hypothetical protein